MSKFNDILNKEKPILIDFYADWCNPCKMMASVLKELKQELQNDITILKIDVENKANAAIVYKYNIQSLPTLILLKDKNLIWRSSGLKRKEELKKIISNNL